MALRVAGGGSGGGGSSTFVGLSDAATANIPAINPNVAAALLPVALGVGPTTITFAAHMVGHYCTVATANSTATFTVAGAGTAVAGAILDVTCGPAGSFFLSGADVVTPPGMRSYLLPGEAGQFVWNGTALVSAIPAPATVAVFLPAASTSTTFVLITSVTLPAGSTKVGSQLLVTGPVNHVGTAGTWGCGLIVGGQNLAYNGGLNGVAANIPGALFRVEAWISNSTTCSMMSNGAPAGVPTGNTDTTGFRVVPWNIATANTIELWGNISSTDSLQVQFLKVEVR